MGVLARRLTKQNLNQVEVFIDDVQNQYIKVQDVPDTFTQGRSVFKVLGSGLLIYEQEHPYYSSPNIQ